MGACEAVPIASRVERIHVPKRIVLLSSWKKLPAFHLSFGVSFDWDNVTICLWHSCVTEARSKYPSNHNHSSKSVSRQIRCRRYHEVQLIRQALPARIPVTKVQTLKIQHFHHTIMVTVSLEFDPVFDVAQIKSKNIHIPFEISILTNLSR